MERRVRGNSHARCEVGENSKIISKSYLSQPSAYPVYASVIQGWYTLLQSHTARTMLANSELVVMLNQAATDREELASLMGISDLQMGYITNVDAGHGLVKIGGALVPFVNKVPRDTKLYALMTTKFGES
mgnify:CR=1 FL=1